MFIEGSQPLGDDLDAVLIGIGSLGGDRLGCGFLGRAGGGLTCTGEARGRRGSRTVWRNKRRSSAMSLAVVNLSVARFDSAFRQIRSSSLGIVSSICRGGRGSVMVICSMISR